MGSSLIRIQIAFNLRHISDTNWGWLLALAIITLILGAVIFMNPLTTTIAITTLIGTLLLITELLNILEYICIIVKLKK